MAWDGIERRKGRSMEENNFTPSGAFEGYVAAKLENIEKRVDVLPCKENFQRLNKVENKIANIEGKATVFGAISGLVAAFISKYILGK